jgi:hypothetical protein
MPSTSARMPSTTSRLPGTYPGDQRLADINRKVHLMMAALGLHGAGGQPVHPREISCTATRRITLVSVWHGTATTRLPGQAIAVSRRNRNRRDRQILTVLPTETDGSCQYGASGAAPCAPRTIPRTPGKMSPGFIRMPYPEMASGVIFLLAALPSKLPMRGSSDEDS